MSARRYGSVVLALVLSALISALEYATGYDFHLTAFFLVSLCWAGWAAGHRAGLLLAMVCAGGWLIADLKAGHLYNHPVEILALQNGK